MLRLVEVRGKDAGEFLHRVTAGTVKSIEPGQGRAGLLLNGRSRVLAQFDLLRLEPQRYQLAAPEECAKALADGLEALHFSEDLEILLTDVRAASVLAPGASRDGAFPLRRDALVVEWPSPVPGYDFTTASLEEPAGWEFARVGALVPWPGSEWAGEDTPALECGMLPWIDRHKGCYPGQEVVELSLNVGHPARVLLAVESSEEIRAWEGAAITSLAHENGKWRALVRVPWAKRETLPAGVQRIASHFE